MRQTLVEILKASGRSKEFLEKLCLVLESKKAGDALDIKKLRETEQDKIACGRKHFDAIGVNYDVVTMLICRQN